MKRTQPFGLACLLASTSITVLGCGGSGDGSETKSRPSVSVAVRDGAAPAGICANGGSALDTGIDDNGNGVLDTSEIDSTQFLCNGADGNAGQAALVSVIAEAAGTHCPAGGSRVDSGLDLDADGVLDPAEITSSTYVCSGAQGAQGNSVVWVEAATDVRAQSDTGYMANSEMQIAVTLPATPALGDVVRVSGVGKGGWKVVQNAGQSIRTNSILSGIGVAWTAHESIRKWSAIASSADGTKLVAVVNDWHGGLGYYGGYLYTSTDAGGTWTPHEQPKSWTAVASSADGARLLAAPYGGQLSTSTDSGVTWTARDAARNWIAVASSADGAKLVAAVSNGQLYTSADTGATWTARETAREWRSVASSADGTKLVAAVSNGQLYTSTDSGVTWTARDLARNWVSVASSADGTKLVAAVSNGRLFTSTDSGMTWTAYETARNWASVASSADGTKLVAAVSTGHLYISTDAGLTWTARDSARYWVAVASSADGTRLFAADDDYWNAGGGLLYTSTPGTTPGASGGIEGDQFESIELQYVGNNTFVVLSHEGDLTVR